MSEEEFGLAIRTKLSFEQTVMRARIALRAHGFSIISEMPAPIGVGEDAGRRHLFMGVWERLIVAGNLGGQWLDVGDHLVCNVVVFEQGGSTLVAGLDPREGLEGWVEGTADAEEAGQALERAMQQIAAEPS